MRGGEVCRLALIDIRQASKRQASNRQASNRQAKRDSRQVRALIPKNIVQAIGTVESTDLYLPTNRRQISPSEEKMNKIKRMALAVVCATLIPVFAVLAHDPSLHGFKLTTFDPPFPSPAFDLPTMKDGTATLADYKGQYVMLNFWATWCPPCLEEMPSMETVHQRYKDKGFTVVAISSDEGGKPDVVPFIEKLGVTFPILLDSDKAVSSVFGAHNLPLTFILDRNGNVIAGAEGARDWESEESLSVLDELIVVNQ